MVVLVPCLQVKSTDDREMKSFLREQPFLADRFFSGVTILVRYGAKNFRVGGLISWEVTVKISGL